MAHIQCRGQTEKLCRADEWSVWFFLRFGADSGVKDDKGEALVTTSPYLRL